MVSGKGVATKPQNIAAIQTRPKPHNVSKLRDFLGLTGYYRRFVKNYRQICRPLHDLLKKDAFHWTVEHDSAFAKLKQVMTTCPVLALPDFSQLFCIGNRRLRDWLGSCVDAKGQAHCLL